LSRTSVLHSIDNGIGSLALEEAPLPTLGQFDVLVRFHALSLNYRDIILAFGKYPRSRKFGVVQGSDGAGEVIATGNAVQELKVGDRVATCFFQSHLSGRFTAAKGQTDLGGHVDGAFRDYGVFTAHGLIKIPSSLSYREAATLPCAALTAWACLFSDTDEHVQPGDTVLTQGTGGVSLFALQFAITAGANVIATTSSSEKVDMLKRMGAKHVINYREVEDWGVKARELSPEQNGADIVVDIGGAATGTQCLKAVRAGNGQVCLVGHRAGGAAEGPPTIWDVRQAAAKVRSIFVGSRQQFENMNKAIDAWKIKPVVDQRVFQFKEMKDAYNYLVRFKVTHSSS
jgi:NADPH:quinone reductase-like Zn-dependent oxidoreductase